MKIGSLYILSASGKKVRQRLSNRLLNDVFLCVALPGDGIYKTFGRFLNLRKQEIWFLEKEEIELIMI